MKKYSIEEACEKLSITRQGMNVRCRKYGIEKIKEGRRSYLTTQQIKILRGSETSTSPEKHDTERFEKSQGVDERLIKRLEGENEYLRKKLDDESEKVKGSLSVIFQQTERIGKLEMENNRLLPYAPLDDIVENDREMEQKRKQEFPDQSWLGKWFGKKGK
jgi:hypothetical protein